MNRRNFIKLATVSPLIPMLAGLVSFVHKPEPISSVQSGDTLTAKKLNDIIERVNELSK